MSTPPDVKVTIAAQEQGVAEAINKLSRELQALREKEGEAAEGAFSMKEAFKGFLEILAVEKLVEFQKEVFNSSVAIAKLNAITGVSTETLSVYTAAAVDLGLSAEDVEKGITKLALSTTQLQTGNQKAAAAFALLGLRAKDFKGLNPDQTLQKVADAVAKAPPGFQRTAAAQKILGESGAALTTVFKQLAGEGFDKAREEAEKFGLLLDSDTAASVLAMQVAISTLKEKSEGTARQFQAGLIPALLDVVNAINNVTTGEGGKGGFRLLGEVAGEVLKSIVTLAYTVVVGILEIGSSLGFMVRAMAQYTVDLVKEGPTKAAGNYRKSLEEGQRLTDAIIQGLDAKFINAIRGDTRQEDAAAAKAKAIADRNKKNVDLVNQEALKGQLKEQQQADAAFKQRIEALNKQSAAEFAITNALNGEKESAEQGQFDRGLVSIKNYYADRRAILADTAKAELDELLSQRSNEVRSEERFNAEAIKNRRAAKAAGADTPAGQELGSLAASQESAAAAAHQKILDLDNKAAVLSIETRKKRGALNQEQTQAEISQASKLATIDKEILDLQGRTADAARAETDQKVLEYQIQLRAAGDPAITAKVKQYRDLLESTNAYNDAVKAGDVELKGLQDDRAAIDLQVASGQIFQLQAEDKLRAATKARIPDLERIAKLQLQAALATGNQALIAQAVDFQRRVAIEKLASTELGDVAKIKAGIQQSLTGSFEQFLTEGVFAARSVGQAFAGLADSIVSSIQKIVTQLLVQIAVTKLLNAVSGGGGGAFGASGLDNLPLGLGFSGGGLVHGPGGPTTDSIPARLSVGEYVFKAAAVDAIGVGVLNQMNRGLHVPQIGNFQQTKFAEGGLVSRGRAGGGDSTIKMQLGLDHGIILKALETKGAGKIVVQHLANNPKQASKAIGRSA